MAIALLMRESDFEVQYILPIDGDRPVVSDDVPIRDTIKDDGIRPVAASSLEADKTLLIDGERPSASEHPEFPDMIRDYID